MSQRFHFFFSEIPAEILVWFLPEVHAWVPPGLAEVRTEMSSWIVLGIPICIKQIQRFLLELDLIHLEIPSEMHMEIPVGIVSAISP